MGYEYVTPLEESLWPLVRRALEGDGSLTLVTAGPRSLALQWSDANKSPHAEELEATFAEGTLRVVFHTGTRGQRDDLLTRLQHVLRAAGTTVTFVED
jgi:hypothetical protein